MLWLLLAACSGPDSQPIERSYDEVSPGPPVAGVAETTIDFPVGSPMGGYSSRCRCLGGSGRVDDRRSFYSTSFVPTTGIHTRARAQILWLENGDQDLVLVKIDAIYTPDDLVSELEARLGEAVGHSMDSKVVVAASHTHHAPANWHQGVTWFLGGDAYHAEVFERMVSSIADAALEAYDARVPAAIGLGYAQDWDPEDRVYRDRRNENNETVFFEDIGAGAYKDPNLALLRVDTAEGEPLGVFFSFGMHGTSLGEDNSIVTTDAPGGVEAVVEDRFDRPVVVAHLQAGGGDASPAGSDTDWARLETVGEYAVDAIIALYDSTPTSSEPIRLETITHAIDTSRDNIRVTRDGTVDWYYPPYDEDYTPDDIVYAEDGSLLSPFDEFNTEYGGAFCGEDVPLIPGYTLDTEAYPYSSCVEVETISAVLGAFFDLDPGTVELPLVESERAQASASRIGPMAIRQADGTDTSDDVLLAFFPGETTAVYMEQFRRRADAELGFVHTMPVGYSQDHEGYLLTPEDWLLGGYEPSINIWGPLQAEHIMEGVLDMSERWLLTDALEPEDLAGVYEPSVYPGGELPTQALDATPLAGTITEVDLSTLTLPLEAIAVASQPEAVLARVQGIAQLAWEGGDPAVDLPQVVLEREVGGSWEPVLTPSGRVVSDTRGDIITAHTPSPLYPHTDEQQHTWWAAWQAVGSSGERAGLPEGTYRLSVTGHALAAGGETTWPYAVEEYTVSSEPFSLVEAELSLSLDDAAGTLSATLLAPAAGWRLVHLEGSSVGANPLEDPLLSWELDDGSVVDDDATATSSGGWSVFSATPPEGAVAAIVVDLWGNEGRLAL